MVGGCELGGKFGLDIIPVLEEFFPSVRESETNGLRGLPPSGRPLRRAANPLFGFRNPESDFRVSQAARSLFIRDNMVEGSEDLVKVDGVSFEDSLPLRRWDPRRTVWGEFNKEFRLGDVTVVGSE
jgi:hypothetical protein